MSEIKNKAQIISVQQLMNENLVIPNYQRPYKWSTRNIENLLADITQSIVDANKYGEKSFRYRIGTIILHRDVKGQLNIVDGQQRVISLVLLNKYLNGDFINTILTTGFSNKISQNNIHRNFAFINDWFSLKKEDDIKKYIEAFSKILEVVVIIVDNISEAFQLFDSQNSRGKALDPHDLLKAYHLREMQNNPYEMFHVVNKWESIDSKKIKKLFDSYLFPILNWSRSLKTKPFTSKEIDAYKGISETSLYTYARRASRASPYFQLTDPFISGKDFFDMVEHYVNLLSDIKSEIFNNSRFSYIKDTICVCEGKDIRTVTEMDEIKSNSVGFAYAKDLFFCALLSYYDKFHNFDEMAVKKIFSWAFMIRVDMQNLPFSTINKYAIGEENSSYTNKLSMFSKIYFARTHTEISSLQISVLRTPDKAQVEGWNKLYECIKSINGIGKN